MDWILRRGQDIANRLMFGHESEYIENLLKKQLYRIKDHAYKVSPAELYIRFESSNNKPFSYLDHYFTL